MKGPTTADLLVQETQKAERLSLLLLSYKCEDIQEFREKLAESLGEEVPESLRGKPG